MIISASRRTDIPAFYTEWFMNRIRAGFCSVSNPFNRNQVSRVSLLPESVDVIVFWTRNPRPLFPYLKDLDNLGYRYFFQYTLIDNPREIDPNSPNTEYSVRTFQELSQSIGPDKVIWRYDPIVLSDVTSIAYHRDHYSRLASNLAGFSRRSVISIMDVYPKASKRLRNLAENGVDLLGQSSIHLAIREFVPQLVDTAIENGYEIFSCSETIDLSGFGVLPGKCVDDDYIQKVFAINVASKKDPSQRRECGCVVSKDIGAYDTCLFGCSYCYATSSFEHAKRQHDEHNPASPSLVGWYEPNVQKATREIKGGNKPKQYGLFDEND